MKKVTHRLFVDLGKLQQFYYIHASLAALALGEETMRPAHECGHLALRQISLLTGSNQTF